ncbi:MAG: chemotaxis protein CheX [Acidobacteriaceae bacterium]
MADGERQVAEVATATGFQIVWPPPRLDNEARSSGLKTEGTTRKGDMMNGPKPEELYEAVCRATEQVFATMLNLEIEAGPPVFDHDFPGHFDGVMSFVGMAGAWLGTGSLFCSAACARRIASSFLMVEFPSVDAEVLDAMGELANIIIGNVKKTVEQSVGPMALSTPTSIVGRELTAHSLGRYKWTVVSFQCGDERLDVMVHLVPRSQPDPEMELRRKALARL